MSIELTKDALDIGIVPADGAASLRFYRDTLGLPEIEVLKSSTGMTIHRLACGNSHVKIWAGGKTSGKVAPGGPSAGVTGIRYFTMSVKALEPIVERCKAAGFEVPWEPRELRPGVRVAMVADPDGNWVELLQR